MAWRHGQARDTGLSADNPFTCLFPCPALAAAKLAETEAAYTENGARLNSALETMLQATLDPRSRDRERRYLAGVARLHPGRPTLGLDLLLPALQDSAPGLLGLLACHQRTGGRWGEQLWPGQAAAARHLLLREAGGLLVAAHAVSEDLYSSYELTVGAELVKLVKERGARDSDYCHQVADFLAAALAAVGGGMQSGSNMHQIFNDIAEALGDTTESQVAATSPVLELVVALCGRSSLGLQLVRASYPRGPCHCPEPRGNGLCSPQCLGPMLHSVKATAAPSAAWEDGVLGRMLAISVAPPAIRADQSTSAKRPDYFATNAASMLLTDYTSEADNANMNTDLHFSFVLRAWEGLLRAGPATRHMALSWLGACLTQNEARRYEGAVPGQHCSTGLLVTLSRLLVTLSLRLLHAPDLARLMEVQADYFESGPAPAYECCRKGGTGGHMPGFPAGATLAPREAGAAGQPSRHGLGSEVFHMAHCALDMGLGQGYKELKVLKTSIRKFSGVEKLVEEGKEAVVTQNQNTPEGVVQVQILVRDKDQMKRLKDDLYQKHACLNTVLLNPQLQDQHKAFIKLTTLWLLRRCGVDATSDFNSNLLSLPVEPPEAVSFLPEFLYDNVHHFLLLHDQPPVDRREPQQDVLLAELRASVLRLLVVLMITPWVRNPHLRARFAQDLEMLLPKAGSREEVYRAAALLQPEFQGSLLQPMAASMSEGLFRDLPCKAALVTAIYSVFVSMEVTGEALHFDEKFSYRYPLNAVLFHLLRMDEFRTEMLAIARSTHRAMAADQQPIYLKFVNILVNDGIRLLDDSLTQLRTLHQLEQEVAAPDWAATSEDEKAEKLADMKKSVDLSTRLNLLSSDNVRLMEALTKLSSDVFVHQDMVDRMANMLDYFLEKVTGRERREYRVKESVQFQPRSLLQSLARIYANLSASTEFVQAIARDGRSYHAGLFEQAAATLAALGAAELEQQVVALAARVAEAAELEQQDTGLTLEAPEEFLDPILATLMREPVLLPSSGKVLDRSTIAKHLLTDQSDPFNRQPLVLAEVVPQAVLRARINAWLLEHQGSSNGQQPAAHGEEKQSVEELNSKESKPVADLDNTSAAQQAAAPARAYGVKVLPRIMRDLKQLRKEAPEDMMVVPDEADFTRIHVVLTGPADTPYEGGFFYFTLDCPPNYPEAPPKALIRTTDGGRVRFNPNLYREGKVCLSILGTWSGPGWTSALSLHSVLLSIQSLMNENPIRNEPGYDNLKDDDPKVKIYNEIIRHEVVRVAFLGMVLNPPSEMPDELHSWVLGRAPRHIAAQLEAVRRHKRLAGHRFDFFENKGVFRWDAMEAELLEVQQNM